MLYHYSIYSSLQLQYSVKLGIIKISNISILTLSIGREVGDTEMLVNV